MTETANSEQLMSLMPPFRLFSGRALQGCDNNARDGSIIIQGLAYYATHTATACAQACIQWNTQHDARDATQCNAVTYWVGMSDLDPADFVHSNGSFSTYSKWNCWLKVFHDICPTSQFEPWPQYTYDVSNRDLLIMQSADRPCASALLRCAAKALHGTPRHCYPNGPAGVLFATKC